MHVASLVTPYWRARWSPSSTTQAASGCARSSWWCACPLCGTVHAMVRSASLTQGLRTGRPEDSSRAPRPDQAHTCVPYLALFVFSFG